jgi:hypothetical protein
MTHRIDSRDEGGRLVIEFQGVLDRRALSSIRVSCTTSVLRGVPVLLVLCLGTEVESGCLEELTGLQGVEVVAQAPFLRRWLERRGAADARSCAGADRHVAAARSTKGDT